jgi:hypothetical protein
MDDPSFIYLSLFEDHDEPCFNLNIYSDYGPVTATSINGQCDSGIGYG